MSARIDMTAAAVGRLTVIAPAHTASGGRLFWSCLCACGGEAVVLSKSLRDGTTKSCGCLHRERAGTMASLRTPRHGHSITNKRTPEYSTWNGMLQRCTNPADPMYRLYGGRGISVHPAWATDFCAFLADMGLRPGKGYSIDRIDNCGNYEPGNCRWATAAEQAANKRTCIYVTIDGETLHLNGWAMRLGVNKGSLTKMKRRLGSAEAAVRHAMTLAASRRAA